MTDAEDQDPGRRPGHARDEVHRESRHAIYRARRAFDDDDATRIHPKVTPAHAAEPARAATTPVGSGVRTAGPAVPAATALTRIVGIAVPAFLLLSVLWAAAAIVVNQGFFSLTRANLLVLVGLMVVASVLWVVVMKDSLKRRTMRRSVMFTALSALVPGLGLTGARTGRTRLVGMVTAAAFVAALVLGGIYALSNVGGVAAMAVDQSVLSVIRFILIALVIVWVTLIAGTHLATRPRTVSTRNKGLGAAVVAFLSFCIAAPLSVGAQYTLDAGRLVDSVFADEGDVNSTSRPSINSSEDDPWASIPRLNILLLGADNSAERNYDELGVGIRTDTIMLASIDTQTGNTTLIQIPRNLQYTPFPAGSEMDTAFPEGFTGAGSTSEWYVNTIWENVELNHPELFVGQTYRGAEALKQGVEGITGQRVDYFMMLDIDGLRELIDAMGGVTVNINQPLPMGSHTYCSETNQCLQPGPNQHLNGTHALWYGRSRSTTSDYDRMARQSCLVDAIIEQANPATMLRSFEGIAAASAQMVVTDIPEQVLQPLVTLSLRVKDARVTRVVFKPGVNGYDYNDPDFEAMRQAVTNGIRATNGESVPSPTPTIVEPTTTPSESVSAEPSLTPSASESPTVVDGAQEVTDACAYNPPAEDETDGEATPGEDE